MNTNHLKKFAQEARKKLIAQVSAKLNYVLNYDSAELREMGKAIDNLTNAIKETSKEQVIEKTAYTWFNRFIALRFMDVNDYQPIGIKILSNVGNRSVPEILDVAKKGELPYRLFNIDEKKKIEDLLDGRLPSSNPHNEVYKLLLKGVCNHYNKYFPFLFKQINDYTELLLPDDLNSEFSILHDIRNGMSEVDCEQVEIIGWLYQFYISERTRELIGSKKKYKRDELAPASQLFTPRWIVEYMVDNTLGQIWTEISPKTKITDSLRYYIKPSYNEHRGTRKKTSIEEIKFFEPCVGSGHILSYAFDVFYKIYEEEGYNPSEIPELIFKNNLYAIDIDQRATQLASFVLMMKAISKDKRFFEKRVSPNISFYEDYKNDANFEYATGLGSLIKVDYKEYNSFKIDHGTILSDSQTELKKLYHLLSQKYDIVVTNPPYIRSSRMEDKLKKYVHSNYPIAKSDLFACFILKCLDLCDEEGLTGYMTPFNWMFISTYEKLRKEIINRHFINNLIQLESSSFDGATVFICTFTLRKKNIDGGLGSYIRLSDFKGSELQSPKTLEAIQNPDCGWFYTSNQKAFLKIPNSAIGYWLNDSLIEIMGNDSLEETVSFKRGLSTANNDFFLRRWYEIAINHSNFSLNSEKIGIKRKWIPYNKGGEYRKWYGNRNFVVNWSNSGETIKKYKGSTFRNARFQFKEGGTYSAVSSTSLSARYCEPGFAFDAAGNMFFSDKRLKTVIAFLNSKVCSEMLKVVCPTINFNLGSIQQLPFIVKEEIDIESTFDIAKEDWNQREISWDFKRNELIRVNGQDLEESCEKYQQYWKEKFFQLHKNEEDLNRHFNEIYDLQNEISPEVPLDEITILKEETSIVNGKLVFNQKEVLSQFISYAVGCMFGRYSLYREGLILANQGETLQDYLLKVGKKIDELSFVPDEDNIIPILDDEWFEDDIVGRLNKFLKVCFGDHNFERNRLFVEECIGKDIRKYFVRDFYKEHIQRYKKRPIYWMFSSPKKSFNVLIYMHRYTSDTLSQLLNSYLKEYIEKLKARMETLNYTMNSSSHSEHNKAAKEKNKIQSVLLELKEYDNVLYTLATERISIDLDDGVLVNYNKFGNAIALVQGLNDNKTKEKVQRFDWIDKSNIR